jgi:hypothetical protein
MRPLGEQVLEIRGLMDPEHHVKDTLECLLIDGKEIWHLRIPFYPGLRSIKGQVEVHKLVEVCSYFKTKGVKSSNLTSENLQNSEGFHG